MVCLGMEDFTFAEVMDDRKIEDGKALAQIGKETLVDFCREE